MRKVFLDELQKDKYGESNRVNWIKSINSDVKFIYDELKGSFKIINYTKEDQFLYVKYLDEDICKIKSYDFIKCKNMGWILGINKYIYSDKNVKRVDLRGLSVTHKGINWNESAGKIIPFVYDNLSGEVQIIKYNNVTRMLTITYLSDTLEINTTAFMDGKLGGLLNKYMHIDKYDTSKPRRVDLRKLPLYGKNIDWIHSIGIKLDFVYDNITGEIEILSYLNDRLKISYLDKEHSISSVNLKKGNLNCIFGEDDRTNYIYAVGDIIDMKNGKIEILSLGKYKSGSQNYTVKCLECGHIRTVDKKGMTNKVQCLFCSNNKFRLSENGEYWIGTTQDNIDFWFDGSEEIIDYVKSFTWRKTCYDYFQNRKGDKLHRIIMSVTDSNIYVNHLGGFKFDNRIKSLTISDSMDNSKEKKLSSRNTSGIVGLIKRKDKWVGSIRVNDVGAYTSYKSKNEATIDLLIVQRHYGFRHNVNLYYLLDNIPQDRIDNVISNIERQFIKERNDIIGSSNIYQLSECGTYYNVYDKKGMVFKIDVENKALVDNGVWHIAYDKQTKTTYIHGTIVVEKCRKTVKLHRYLFDLLDIKYKNIFVDHLNGDSLDNRMINLQLTDANGNGKNKPAKGYMMRWGKARASITINGKIKSKTFETEKEASDWYQEQRKISMNNRLTFKSKTEVDEYLLLKSAS